MVLKIGKFLKFWRNACKVKLSDIAERAKGLNNRPTGVYATSSFFSQLENDRIKINPDHLEFIAEVYQCSLFVLLSYYPEQLLNFVHLEKKDGFQKAPFDDPKVKGVTYYIGKYQLKDSLVVPVRVVIKSKCRSEERHYHPGEELMIVEEGNINLVFPKLKITYSLKKGDVMHFNANNIHYTENNDELDAKVIVIRVMVPQEYQED